MSPDFLVIGAGVAGLRAAIELAEAGQVLVVAKDTLRESSSEYAQGGIAVALSDDDEGKAGRPWSSHPVKNSPMAWAYISFVSGLDTASSTTTLLVRLPPVGDRCTR